MNYYWKKLRRLMSDNNDEARMTNDKGMSKLESVMGVTINLRHFWIRHSDLFRHWSFARHAVAVRRRVIRHFR